MRKELKPAFVVLGVFLCLREVGEGAGRCPDPSGVYRFQGLDQCSGDKKGLDPVPFPVPLSLAEEKVTIRIEQVGCEELQFSLVEDVNPRVLSLPLRAS